MPIKTSVDFDPPKLKGQTVDELRAEVQEYLAELAYKLNAQKNEIERSS